MKVFTCTEFAGHYPVGVAAVIVAASPELAARHLERTLAEAGLPQKIDPSTMEHIKSRTASCTVLLDGNY